MSSKDKSLAAAIKHAELDLSSAQRWANEGRIEAWVHKYLLSETGGSTNALFSAGLKRERRWWNGPVEVDLTTVSPAVGTTSDMEYRVDQADWNARIAGFAETFTQLEALPPLIVQYRDGALSLRDGNTRYGAMRLLGWPTCWIIIWYDSEVDFYAHEFPTKYQK